MNCMKSFAFWGALLAASLHANQMNTGGQLGVARTVSTYTLGQGSLYTGLSVKGDYAYRDIRVQQADGSYDSESPVLLSQDLFVGYGLFNWLDASLDLPVYQDFWDGRSDNVGLGDLVLGLKMEHPGLYTEAPFRMAYMLRTLFPTGSDENGYYQRHSYYVDGGVNEQQSFTAGGVAFSPAMIWTLDFGKFPSRFPLQLHGNLGAFIKVWDTDHTGRRSQTALLGSLAAEYQFNSRWGSFVELSGEARLAEFVKGYNFVTDLNNDLFRVSAGPTLKLKNGMRSQLSVDVGISDRNDARTSWITRNEGVTRYTTTNTPRIGATLTLGYAQRGKNAGPARGRFFATADTVLLTDTLKVLKRDTLQIVKNDTVVVTKLDTIVVIKNDTLRIVQHQNPNAIIEYGARVFPNVNFFTGSSELIQSSFPILNDIAQSLINYPNVRLDVRGYTDATGSDELNGRLSQDRAEAVVNYLLTKGVPRERLRAVGMGPSNPIADNSTVEGRTLNRRVEIKRVD